jgi:hypothetical protein
MYPGKANEIHRKWPAFVFRIKGLLETNIGDDKCQIKNILTKDKKHEIGKLILCNN